MAEAANFTIEQDGDSGNLRLRGTLDLYHTQDARKALQKALRGKSATVDVSQLTKLDTVGALLLRQLQEKNKIHIEHLKPEHAELFKLVEKADMAPPKVKKP